MVTTFLGSVSPGDVDGVGTSVKLNFPDGMCLDPYNHNYFYLINHYHTGFGTLHKVIISNATSTRIGSSKSIYFYTSILFYFISSDFVFDRINYCAVDKSSNIFVTGGYRVVKVSFNNQRNASTFAGTSSVAGF